MFVIFFNINLFKSSKHNKQQNLIYFSDNNKYLFNIKNEIKLIDPKIKVVIIPEFDCNFSQMFHQPKILYQKELKHFMNLFSRKQKDNFFDKC